MNRRRKINPNANKVAIYARYSTEHQDSDTIDVQINRCTELVAKHGREVHEIYKDCGISGTHNDRPGLQKLLQDASAGLFSYVYVNDSSRLSRDPISYLNLVFVEFKSKGIVLVDCKDNSHSTDPTALLLAQIMGIVNAQMIKSISYHTHNKLAEIHRSKDWTGGCVFGYDSVPRNPNEPDGRQKLVVNEKEAALVKEMARIWLETGSMQAVASRLNQTDFPAPKLGVGRWQASSIRQMMRNERYAGTFKWNTSKSVRLDINSKKRIPQARPESEHLVQEIPELAIFDKTTWQAIQDRFPTEGRREPRQRVSLVSLYNGSEG